jgi:integrase
MKDGIERLGPSRFRIRVQARDKRTKRRLSRTETLENATAAQARARLAEVRREVRGGRVGRSRPRLLGYATSWLEQRAGLLKPSVVAKYGNSLLRHIGPRMGEMYVDEIVPGDVQRYVSDRMAAGGAGNTILNELRLLRVLAKDSLAEGVAARNWADRVRPPPVRSYDEERPNLLGAGQLGLVLGAVPPQWRTLVGLMALTGLRWGEASGLRWEDLDDAAGVIRVRRGNWKGVVTTPKTERSRRIVPIPPGLKRDGRAGWMFPTSDGQLHRGTPLVKVMRKACEAAGVPYTTPHGLRRTFNNLARQVTTDQILKSMMGHATDGMTQHYSLVGADEKRRAQSAVLALIEASATEVTTTSTPAGTKAPGVISGTTKVRRRKKGRRE